MTPLAPGSQLERMRSPEIAEAVASGWTTVVLAAGAVEQHGPHLPLFVDAERGTRLAVEVARRMKRTLVAPTLRVGCSEHHMAFAGTLTVRPETLEALVTDVCTSLARHGFRTLCLLPTHGGNFGPLRHMLPRVAEAVGDGCTVRAYTDLVGFLEIWRHAVEEAAGLGERVGGHADVAETSEMLEIAPETVRTDLAEVGYTGGFDQALLDRFIAEGFDAVTPNGILGDARGATAEIGRRCLARAADVIAAGFQDQVPTHSPGDGP